MNHSEARRLLVDFELDSLDEATHRAVAVHVEACSACRQWVESYRVLGRALGGSSPREETHPESDLLALWAVQPEDVEEGEQSRLRAHLSACRDCRRDIDRVQAALFEAKRPMSLGGRPWQLHHGHRVAIAAGLAVLLVGAALWFRSGTIPPDGAEELASWETGAAMAPVANQQLSGIELDGAHLIEAERKLTITDVKVTAGSTVTFRAGQGIVFGNGFQIGPDTKVAIEVSTPGRRELHYKPERSKGDSG